jgi:hypothetical protein
VRPLSVGLQDSTTSGAPLALGLLAPGLVRVAVETLAASGDSLVSLTSVHCLSSFRFLRFPSDTDKVSTLRYVVKCRKKNFFIFGGPCRHPC